MAVEESPMKWKTIGEGIYWRRIAVCTPSRGFELGIHDDEVRGTDLIYFNRLQMHSVVLPTLYVDSYHRTGSQINVLLHDEWNEGVVERFPRFNASDLRFAILTLNPELALEVVSSETGYANSTHFGLPPGSRRIVPSTLIVYQGM